MHLRLSPPTLLALGSLALSACATRPAPTPAPVAPIELTPALETSPCLRGSIPDPEGLTVGDGLAFGAERHRDAICERSRGDAVVKVVSDFNASLAAHQAPPKKKPWWQPW